MLQQARNLTDPADGFLRGKRVPIHDRDAPVSVQSMANTVTADTEVNWK